MTKIAAITNRERRNSLIAIVVLYTILIVCFIALKGAPTQPAKAKSSGPGLVSFDVILPKAQPTKVIVKPVPKIVLPSPVQIQDKAQDDPVIGNISSGGCDPAQAIANAIRDDPAALRAIHDAPADLHTEAGVFSMWNGDWNVASTDPEGVLAPVRTNIANVLAQLPSECVDADVQGPRFIFASADDKNFVLAFGSDTWRWSTLLAPRVTDLPDSLLDGILSSPLLSRLKPSGSLNDPR